MGSMFAKLGLNFTYCKTFSAVECEGFKKVEKVIAEAMETETVTLT
jgi:hypothetical protein